LRIDPETADCAIGNISGIKKAPAGNPRSRNLFWINCSVIAAIAARSKGRTWEERQASVSVHPEGRYCVWRDIIVRVDKVVLRKKVHG
jgi:hypothetical protein